MLRTGFGFLLFASLCKRRRYRSSRSICRVFSALHVNITDFVDEHCSALCFPVHSTPIRFAVPTGLGLDNSTCIYRRRRNELSWGCIRFTVADQYVRVNVIICIPIAVSVLDARRNIRLPVAFSGLLCDRVNARLLISLLLLLSALCVGSYTTVSSRQRGALLQQLPT